MLYLDNAATTPVKQEVIDAMMPYFTENFGNPSTVYELGNKSRKAINDTRKVIAASLNVDFRDIYFTSGGTESNNQAILGVVEACGIKNPHIITSKVEHHSVLNPINKLKKHGIEVSYVDVDKDGFVEVDNLIRSIRDNTILISIMFANNEIGSLMPIAQIGEIAKKKGIIFHTDAVAAYMHTPIDANKLNIDMLSASGHKFHGPKGSGFLYIKSGAKVAPLISGGSQERNMRGGTENIPAIVGMGEAVRLAMDGIEERIKTQTHVRNHLIKRIISEIPDSKLNGSLENRLSSNIDISFKNVESESLLIMLDSKGICASGGSACASADREVSHVLKAIGISDNLAKGSLRMTIDETLTIDDADYCVDSIKSIVAKLRSLRI